MNFENQALNEIKETSVNSGSGVVTCEVAKGDLYFALLSWYGVDDLGFTKASDLMASTVRGFKEIEDGFKFKHGVGYDWRSDDLLSNVNTPLNLFNYFLDCFYIPRVSNEDVTEDRLNKYAKEEATRQELLK